VLRAAGLADMEAIRRWRNHPEVRRTFIHTAEIAVEQHREWWRITSSDPRSHVLIYENDDVPCGVVIFKDHDVGMRRAEWGFFLDIESLKATGKLFAAWIELEREAVRYGMDQLGLAVMGGRTLASNKSVLELHRRQGFVEVPERCYATDIDGRLTEVVWMELRREQWSFESAPSLR
jgi:RimJ/RimL family protein N-acetyltransferase